MAEGDVSDAQPRRSGTTTALWVLGLVAFALAFAACGGSDEGGGGGGGGGGNSLGDRIDQIDTANGIRVTITGCRAQQGKPTFDGIPQTVYTAAGTVENTTGDPRLGVKVHVTFLDGDKEFYDTDVSDKFSFGGLEDRPEQFSESVKLSDEVKDLRCKGTAK